jgi:hypothetical protein
MTHQSSSSPLRDGTTVVEAGYPPLIVYVDQMHDNDEALMDTLFHEAIHAAGRLVGRFESQPDNILTEPYWLEELTAIYGAQLLGKHFGIRDRETHHNMQRVAEELMQCISKRKAIPQALDRAEEAVAFFLQPSVAVAE